MARQSAAAKAKALAEQAAEAVEEICGHCWPGGWPHGAHSASCAHGEYERPDPNNQTAPASPGPTEEPESEPTPADPTEEV